MGQDGSDHKDAIEVILEKKLGLGHQCPQGQRGQDLQAQSFS